MFLIGLTGGIAAGKSVVARRLAERGAVIVDADVVAREVVAPGTPGLAAIRDRFGDAVIAADGSLDRPALGSIVFGDPDARRALEGITHPAIQALVRQRIDEAHAADPRAVVVYDVPLLVEAGRQRDLAFDLVVVAHAPAAVRRERLVETRGMSGDEADRRIASQATDDERRAVADVVIDTTGSMEATLIQVDAVWERAASAA